MKHRPAVVDFSHDAVRRDGEKEISVQDHAEVWEFQPRHFSDHLDIF